jgi:hypothetical protein
MAQLLGKGATEVILNRHAHQTPLILPVSVSLAFAGKRAWRLETAATFPQPRVMRIQHENYANVMATGQ